MHFSFSSLFHPKVITSLLALSLIFFLSYKVIFYSSLPTITLEKSIVISSLPDFSIYTQITEKKRAFFELLYPIIEAENQHVLTLHQQLIKLKIKSMDNLSDDEKEWLLKLATHYQVKPQKNDLLLISSLLIKVDTIPPSLVLSQAAIESGWGSSRFSRQGNNLFGQWCFKKGCGMVPLRRQEGLNHEVLQFDSVNQSIRTYIRNLNSLPAYKEFRQLRQNLLLKKLKNNVFTLAEGLKQYSEQGVVYVDKVNQMIRQNNLEQYDLRYTKALNNMLK